MNPGAASLLRLYMNANDRSLDGKKLLYEAVVLKARAMGMAGATVFNAPMGYGVHRVVRDAASEYSFMDAPVIVEIVDRTEQIEALLAALKTMVDEGLVTVNTIRPVRVVHYVHTSE